MIQRLRSWVAFALATIVILVTLGRTKVNRTGYATADVGDSGRLATASLVDTAPGRATKDEAVGGFARILHRRKR